MTVVLSAWTINAHPEKKNLEAQQEKAAADKSAFIHLCTELCRHATKDKHWHIGIGNRPLPTPPTRVLWLPTLTHGNEPLQFCIVIVVSKALLEICM